MHVEGEVDPRFDGISHVTFFTNAWRCLRVRCCSWWFACRAILNFAGVNFQMSARAITNTVSGMRLARLSRVRFEYPMFPPVLHSSLHDDQGIVENFNRHDTLSI